MHMPLGTPQDQTRRLLTDFVIGDESSSPEIFSINGEFGPVKPIAYNLWNLGSRT